MGLGDGVREVLYTSLKYLALSQNVLGLDVIEQRVWVAITSYESKAMAGIGFMQLTLDCW